jgi:PHD/YefM family antitoxin component YafN of YafNO toxin-antitoxin module
LQRNAEKVRAMNVQEQFVVDSEGKKTGVILSLKRYRKLMEDLHDLAVVAERRDEEPISLEQMKRRLTRDGIL